MNTEYELMLTADEARKLTEKSRGAIYPSIARDCMCRIESAARSGRKRIEYVAGDAAEWLVDWLRDPAMGYKAGIYNYIYGTVTIAW